MNTIPSNRDTLASLIDKNVLGESIPHMNLARTLVVTSSEFPNPRLWKDTESQPKFTLCAVGGALLLYERGETDDFDPLDLFYGQDGASQYIHAQIKLLVKERLIDSIVLVTNVPSIGTEAVSYAQIIHQAMCVESQVRSRYKKMVVASFLCAYLSIDEECHLQEGEELNFLIDPIAFTPWYNKYQQDFLGMSATDLTVDDDEEDELGTNAARLGPRPMIAPIGSGLERLPNRHPQDRRR